MDERRDLRLWLEDFLGDEERRSVVEDAWTGQVRSWRAVDRAFAAAQGKQVEEHGDDLVWVIVLLQFVVVRGDMAECVNLAKR